MACILYREGKGTIAHGVECESTTCEIEHLDSMIKSGWLQNPPGYEPPEPVAVEEEIAEDDDSETVESQLRADVERLEGEVENLNEQLDVQKQIEESLNAEVARLNELINALEAFTPPESTEEDEPPTNGEQEEGQEDDVEQEETADGNLDPVRVQAREAGIEGWDTKRITTLKKALEA